MTAADHARRLAIAAATVAAGTLAACVASSRPLGRAAAAAASLTAPSLPAPPRLKQFPVRGRHDTGYDAGTDQRDRWSCDDARSNSDFCTSTRCTWHGAHLGNDIWADEGTPVVATVDGTLIQSEWSDYSGNRITIRDASGWSHFSAHLQRRSAEMAVGRAIRAGEVIGFVGKTGSAANGVVHLHYSIYPGDDYESGVDPWPYLRAVEHGVCAATATR